MKVVGLTFCVALVCGIGLTWLVRRLAVWCNVLDHPDGVRKLHGRSVPLLGGVAVFVATGLAALTGVAYWHALSPTGVGAFWAYWTARPVATEHWAGMSSPLALALAAVAVTIVGVLDDVFELRARLKLAGQVIAGGILVAGGLLVERVSVFGISLELGVLGFAFTVFWLVGAMNAFNLLDGLDGLASGVGLIISLTVGLMSILAGATASAMLAFALAGALAAFLLYNFPPASIFLGDSGSMLIGLLLGALAIESSLKSPATAAVTAPLVALTIPIFDSFAAVVRRRLSGRELHTPDRGHIHHCLLQRGLSNRQVLACVCALCAVTGAAALASVYARSELMAAVTAMAVVGCLIMTRLFGHSEYLLVKERMSAMGRASADPRARELTAPAAVSNRFLWCRSFEEAWQMLIEAAKEWDVGSVQLELTRADEPHCCQWTRPGLGREPADAGWEAALPVCTSEQVIGRLLLGGGRAGRGALVSLAALAAVTGEFGEACKRLLAGPTVPLPRVGPPRPHAWHAPQAAPQPGQRGLGPVPERISA